MSLSNFVLIEEPIEKRIENIYNEYVVRNLKKKNTVELSIYLRKKLAKISNRLGGVKYSQVDKLIQNAFENSDEENHYKWIEILLISYYDKMYEYQLEQKKDRCIHIGSWLEIFENLAPETRRAELKLRTKMLQNHQKLAMVSLGLLAYQYSLGQQVIDSGFAPKYTSAHRKYSTVTWGFYMTSASLSYFAPPALVYEKRVSSMKIHRWLSYIHFAGMIALPVLGKNISKSGYELSATNLHQDVATVTFVSMILSGLLTILPY